jgi:hypothetical protein
MVVGERSRYLERKRERKKERKKERKRESGKPQADKDSRHKQPQACTVRLAQKYKRQINNRSTEKTNK